MQIEFTCAWHWRVQCWDWWTDWCRLWFSRMHWLNHSNHRSGFRWYDVSNRTNGKLFLKWIVCLAICSYNNTGLPVPGVDVRFTDAIGNKVAITTDQFGNASIFATYNLPLKLIAAVDTLGYEDEIKVVTSQRDFPLEFKNFNQIMQVTERSLDPPQVILGI